MKPGLLLLSLAALGLITSCKKQGAELPPDVVAEVGGRFIRVADVEAAWKARGSSFSNKAALLEELVQREALVARALQAGLDQDPETQRAWESLLIGKLKERDLEPRQEKAAVQDEEIEAFYREQAERYTVPARRRLAMLHLRAFPQMSDTKRVELKTRLEEARQRAQQLGPEERGFGALAIAFSEDQTTRYKGGDLGWVDVKGHSRCDPEVLAAGFALAKKGDLTDVLEAKDGFYVLKLVDLREASVKPLAEVREAIRHELRQRRQGELERGFFQESRQVAAVRILTNRLAALSLPQ